MLTEFKIKPLDGRLLQITDLVRNLQERQTVVDIPHEQGADSLSYDPPESIYVICWNEAQAQRVRAWLVAGNTLDEYHGSVGLLSLTPRCITVYQAAPAVVIAQIRELLLPLLRAQHWQLFRTDGDETQRYERRPELLFD